MEGYWMARAIYEDGFEVDRMFEDNPEEAENSQIYRMECWLIERHEGCVWYSVNWVPEYDPATDY